jgi:two-component system nitrogen regulation response regulator NtrX
MRNELILVIDDEKNICRSMEIILSSEGYRVKIAGSAKEGVESFQKNKPGVVFLDVKLPDKDGLDLLKEIKETYPQTEVIMISGHATLSMAVEATKSGAYDFLEKPLIKEKILLTLKHLLERNELKNRYKELEDELIDNYKIVGSSPALQKVLEQVNKVAETDSKVLILGESGTGKELIAWAIHQGSPRKDHPFVKMNCAAIPEELTESELFGSEKGAFTGASERREGKFMQAHHGSIFLDEIADMSLKVQTKVLRVLQDGKFERLGGKETLEVDVRVIAATNKNLDELVKSEGFREDLYYRLNVFPIHLPALRERKEDIPELIGYFIKKYCLKNNRKPVELVPGALKILQEYSWPGNIRELQNLLERLLILGNQQMISESDLPPYLVEPTGIQFDTPQSEMDLKSFKERTEREYIEKCLDRCNGNVSETARMLGIERTNLHKKMKALGIER